MQDVETRLDGDTLVVRIPMRFQRRGGRKRIVAPDGSEIAPSAFRCEERVDAVGDLLRQPVSSQGDQGLWR
jgi:hypothetical protein